MVFSSAVFLFLFLPIAILVYYSPLCNTLSKRNIWLLITSLIFYAWGEPLYVFLMILSIIVNYYLGRWVSTCPQSSKGKRVVAVSCLFNLGLLFFFKYLGWLLRGFGIITMDSSFSKIVMPIGISFYTFQALSYVIDVYRGNEKAQTSVLNVGLYIAFFPQLIAGPIVRYGTISEQLLEREHSMALFTEGAERFIIGLSKKLLLANQLAVVSEKAFAAQPSERSVLFAWMGIFAFTLQIYFDFSGYSDMAIGLGKMFGFEFLENFNYPYVSRSVTEYWRRWHMSLGGWFRDYVYYPLTLGPAIKIRKLAAKLFGRKRAGIVSGGIVMFILWTATGMWHGANLTFVFWGMLQFVFLFWEQYRKPIKNPVIASIVGFITTYLIVMCTKVMFNADSISHMIGYYASMLGLSGNGLTDVEGLYWIKQYKVFIIIGAILEFPLLPFIKDKLVKANMAKLVFILSKTLLCALLILDICYAVGGGYNPFIYFNF